MNPAQDTINFKDIIMKNHNKYIKRDINILKTAQGELNLSTRIIKSKKIYSRKNYKISW